MNDSIFFFFYNLAHQSVFFDKLIIFFADTFPYIVVFLVFLFLVFYKKNFKETILVFFSSALAWFLAYILKILFHTQRPFDIFPTITSLIPETGYAFPSRHATFFMALAFALFFNHKKVGLPAQAGYIFIFSALLIGIARIVAGVHFPIDILGGFLLGFLVAYFLKNV